MLEKFIEMVEHQAAAYKLQCDIEDGGKYDICSLDRIQLMDASQELFDGFCNHFGLTPRITVDTSGTPHTRTQRVCYKDIAVFVYGDVADDAKAQGATQEGTA